MNTLLSSLVHAFRQHCRNLHRHLTGRSDSCTETLHGIDHLLGRWPCSAQREHLEQLGYAIDELTDRIVEQDGPAPSEHQLRLMQLRSLLLQLFHASRMDHRGRRTGSLLQRSQQALHAVAAPIAHAVTGPAHLHR
ncbi:MAG TPA: hypothetical protein VGE21_12015 [Flavobacteriales bacterium]